MGEYRMTLEELRDKSEWEGGVGELIDYGITPDEVPVELEELWREASAAWRIFSDTSNSIDKVMYGY